MTHEALQSDPVKKTLHAPLGDEGTAVGTGFKIGQPKDIRQAIIEEAIVSGKSIIAVKDHSKGVAIVTETELKPLP